MARHDEFDNAEGQTASTGAKKPNYGLDAPEVVRRFALIGGICIGIALAAIAGEGKWLPIWTRYFVAPCLSVGCTFAAQAAVMIWGSKRGKLRLRDRCSTRYRGEVTNGFWMLAADMA
jgi:arsenite methyltransferase